MNKQLKIKLLNVLNADLKRTMEVDTKEVVDEKLEDIYKLYKIINAFDDREFNKVMNDYFRKKYEKEKWQR